ncbi:MAG: HD-GYP domain-containing protein [Acidobacteria bacterium]|nr:HD-GYP domain-containing protein [Acidobacteriota bacterium]
MAIKRVAVGQLRPGMYIHDLRRGYFSHGFIHSHFVLRDEEQIRKIKRQGIVEVDIDTARGLDVPGPSEPVAPGSEPAHHAPRLSHREEAQAARRILSEAGAVAQGLLQQVRLGKQVDPSRARPVVEEVQASLARNPGALIGLARLKQVDTYTFQHSVSVCALLVAFCNGQGMSAEQAYEAGLGGLLHDAGKMRIPPEILNKPGPLSPEEFAVMKSHASLGRRLLEDLPGISEAVLQVAAEHHERLGGAGYPSGCRGRSISLLGRMAAIADVYDAITSDRCYHRGLEPTEALRKLLEWSGDHLDGELVERFIRTLGIYPVGSLVRLVSGRLAVVLEQGPELLKPVVGLLEDSRRGPALPGAELDLAGGTDGIESYADPLEWGLAPGALL